MGQVRHGSATTTHVVRAAIQRSQTSLAQLSKELGINPKTVAKWRKRSTVEDLKTGPKKPRSTVLTEAEEAMIVAFRRHMLLHLDGNNHTYVHESADIEKAVGIVQNAKMRRTGICGATECIVIDSQIAEQILPRIVSALDGCEFRGDTQAQAIVPTMVAAKEADWDTEYLSSILSVKIVDGLQQGMAFVQAHSSGHTDAIIAEDVDVAKLFMNAIDSAVVMHNASTQFSDGGEFGMGAEIGIATGKMHARGPVGAEQLTSFKYFVHGTGQQRP